MTAHFSMIHEGLKWSLMKSPKTYWKAHSRIPVVGVISLLSTRQFLGRKNKFTTNSTWQFLISMLLVAVLLQPWKEMVNFLMNLQWERTCASSGPRILNHQLWRGISFQDGDTKRVRWLSSSVIFVGEYYIAKGCRLKRWLRTTHFEDIPFLWINHGRKAMVTWFICV